MADFPDLASAEAEGYAISQGFTSSGFFTSLEKQLSGEPGHRMINMRAVAESTVDQPSADAAALANLNAQRAFRYGDGNAGMVDEDFQHVPDET